jgi:hypothetical protein
MTIPERSEIEQLRNVFLSPALTWELLDRSLELAQRFAPLARRTLNDQAAGIVQHVAAAALVRLPGLLRAVRILLKEGLVVESEPLVRVLVELAIVAM